MSSSSSAEGEIRKLKPRRWHNLKQQTLPAWQPVLSTKFVSPLLISFGILLVPLGVVVFLVSNNIKEVVVDYTDCISLESDSGKKCADIIRDNFDVNCSCKVNFELSNDFEGEVHMYYGLTDFYQNHRTYIESRDDDQLLGKIGSIGNLVKPAKSCDPFAKDKDGKTIIPCGAIANSMFNDTIKLTKIDEDLGESKDIPLVRKGISWKSDQEYRFSNPESFSNKDDPIWKDFVKPRDWDRWLWDLDPESPDNNGLQNEDFIVWMRPAALSSFRKLYRRIPSGGLQRGNYTFEIQYEYEVKSFGGTKSIILTETSSFLGGKNPYLGIATFSAGGVVILLGLLFLLSLCRRKKTWKKRESSSIHKNYGTHNNTAHSLRTSRSSGRKKHAED